MVVTIDGVKCYAYPAASNMEGVKALAREYATKDGGRTCFKGVQISALDKEDLLGIIAYVAEKKPSLFKGE